MPIRENAGYEIIGAVTVKPNVEIVLGKNENAFVTWECTDGSSYYWGHYFNGCTDDVRNDAFEDFVERARCLIK